MQEKKGEETFVVELMRPGRKTVRNRLCAGLLSLLLITASACSRHPNAAFHWEPENFRVKGTYYQQPRAAINNFWNSVDIEQCQQDFAQLRADGFNTIILTVPWGVFQPTIHPIHYNERAFADLERLLALAETYGLKVALRVGTHDHIPRDASGGNWIEATVLSDDREWAAYRELFREVAARTRAHRNLLFIFWTFEDAGYTPDLWLHQYPQNVAAFREWLRRRPLWFWNLLWREKNASYDAVEPPNQNQEPLKPMKLRAFLEFSDHLVARRLPDACLAAKEGNPAIVVSFQPRAEVNWRHDYREQFELPSCYTFVTTWFSPYQSYLFGDTSQELDGARTASYLPRYIERTRRLARDLPVFVDQLNFQHFGGHAAEGALRTETEQQKFVSAAVPVLLRDSLGYALWNYHDYYMNVVENGLFHMGLDAWETAGGRALVEWKSDGPRGEPRVELRARGVLRQKVTSTAGNKEYKLSFVARSAAPRARLRVQVRFLPAGQLFEANIEAKPSLEQFELKFTTPADSNALEVSFAVERGQPTVSLQEVILYPWIDTGGLYDVKGNPRLALRDLFCKLNAATP